MTEIIELDRIQGVKLVVLRSFSDERGRFLETFRKDWFPERSWTIVQTNRSDSQAGVLRGLHYHFQQVDYWYVARGQVRVGLADLRQGSATCGASTVVELGEQHECGLLIPSGVAHGFYALTAAKLTYLVDNYYDGQDEHGVAWNDPTLAVPWGITDPILSARDRANPRLSEILPGQRP